MVLDFCVGVIPTELNNGASDLRATAQGCNLLTFYMQ